MQCVQSLFEIIADLEAEYNAEIEPKMEFLREQKEIMGDRYPEAMFLPKKLVAASTVVEMFAIMTVSTSHPYLYIVCRL